MVTFLHLLFSKRPLDDYLGITRGRNRETKLVGGEARRDIAESRTSGGRIYNQQQQ